MAFLSSSTWWFLLGFWVILSLVLAAYGAVRSRIAGSRFGQIAGMVGGAVLTLWVIVMAFTIYEEGFFAAITGLIVCCASGYAALRGVGMISSETQTVWMSRLKNDCQAEAQAILDTLHDSNVQSLIKELRVTEEKLHELYSHLRRLGLDETTAHGALADSELLRRYFAKGNEPAAARHGHDSRRRKARRSAA